MLLYDTTEITIDMKACYKLSAVPNKCFKKNFKNKLPIGAPDPPFFHWRLAGGIRDGSDG